MPTKNKTVTPLPQWDPFSGPLLFEENKDQMLHLKSHYLVLDTLKGFLHAARQKNRVKALFFIKIDISL